MIDPLVDAQAGLGDSIGSLTMAFMIAMASDMLLFNDWPSDTWGQLLMSPAFSNAEWEWQVSSKKRLLGCG